MSNEERAPDSGNAALEWFFYEIMWLCLVIPLTKVDELRKIQGIPKTKRKAADPLSAFTQAPELPTAILYA
jgi:hypothetical protein